MLDLNDAAIIVAFALVLGLLRSRFNARAEREHDVARENLALKKMAIQMRSHPKPGNDDSGQRC